MKYKKQLLITTALIGVICCCVVIYTIQLAAAKQRYKMQISGKLHLLLEQQQALLQRLGKQLVVSIQQQNFVDASRQLRIYEDQIFVLAKQGLTVPVKIQWVSLNVPQVIITSDGNTAEQMLAPDENYYLRIVSDPTHLQISANYFKEEMPEYTLFNMGLGMVDNQHTNLGLLDISLSCVMLHEYIANNLGFDAKFFDFNLPEISRPEIVLRANVYLAGMLTFTASVLLGVWIICALIVYGLKLYRHMHTQDSELKTAKDQIASLTTGISMYRAANNAQIKYGSLALDHNAANAELVFIPELLTDMFAVNAELAVIRKIKVNVPHEHAAQLYMLGTRVRLMQILSGILYEIINQLPASSTINVQLVINDKQSNLRKFTFKFIDNGFYNSLTDSQELPSNADIRAKGWDNIQRLIELEGGSFEHIHVAYNGNTICFVVTVPVVANNVINLENYLTEMI